MDIVVCVRMTTFTLVPSDRAEAEGPALSCGSQCQPESTDGITCSPTTQHKHGLIMALCVNPVGGVCETIQAEYCVVLG